MKIQLTRKDIKQHAAALERIEALEEWRSSTGAAYRYIVLKHNNENLAVGVKCGHSAYEAGPEKDEEAIFRKHLDSAVEEAIAFWRKRASLDE